MRIVEIAKEGRHLAVSRGFMSVSADGEEIARIPLDSIAAVIANAYGLTYSNNLLVKLAEHNAILVICGPNHAPAASLWATEGHHMQSARIEGQVRQTLPKSKQLWKQLVQAKIGQQAAVLKAVGQPHAPVAALVRKVRSGDPENIEAQAARRYWKTLFGKDFRRDQSGDGQNALLNYGYTILRATVARAVMAAGLHPSIGLHHANQFNTMRLVDDLIEPFRPFVDFAVFNLLKKNMDNVNPETKRILAGLPEMEVLKLSGATAMRTAINDMASSLGLIYEGRDSGLDLPNPQPPLWQMPA